MLAVAEGARPGHGRDWLVPVGLGVGGEVGLAAVPAPLGLGHRTFFSFGSEAALDDLCATEPDVDDPEMDCG